MTGTFIDSVESYTRRLTCQSANLVHTCPDAVKSSPFRAFWAPLHTATYGIVTEKAVCRG